MRPDVAAEMIRAGVTDYLHKYSSDQYTTLDEGHLLIAVSEVSTPDADE